MLQVQTVRTAATLERRVFTPVTKAYLREGSRRSSKILHTDSSKRVDSDSPVFLNVTGIGQSTYKYTMRKKTEISGYHLWRYRSPHPGSFRDCVIRSIG